MDKLSLNCCLLWMLVFISVSVGQSLLNEDIKHLQHRRSAERRQQFSTEPLVRVISSAYIIYGIQNTVLLQVSTDILNATSRITPANWSCLSLHEKYHNRLRRGQHNFISFTIWPSEELKMVQKLNFYLVKNNSILYKHTLEVKYPSIHLWSSQLHYTKQDILRIWAYSHSPTTLPVPGMELMLTLKKVDASSPKLVAEYNVTTSASGLTQLEQVLGNMEEGEYRMTARHRHQVTDAVTSPLFIHNAAATRRHLNIDVTTTGYHRHTKLMTIRVHVRRPGLIEVEGKVKLTYCQQSSAHCKHTKLDLVRGNCFILAAIDHQLTDTVHSLNISATVIEQKTGVIENIALDLDIYPHRLDIETSNTPTVYTPGLTLHIPLMVLQRGTAARDHCILVEISTPTALLYSGRLATDNNGEIIVDWLVPNNVTGDLVLEATDCERSQPTVSRIILVQHQPGRELEPRLRVVKYRYSIGDIILLNSSNANGLQDILIYRCGGDILGVLHLTNDGTLEVKVTRDMYPCVKFTSLQHSITTRVDQRDAVTNSLTIHIDNPNKYNITTGRALYEPGQRVALQISPTLSSEGHPVLSSNTTLLLLAIPDTAGSTVPKILPRISYTNNLVKTIRRTLPVNMEMISTTCESPSTSDLNGDSPSNKLNLVTLAPVPTTSNSNVMGRRPNAPSSNSRNRIRHAEGRVWNHESLQTTISDYIGTEISLTTALPLLSTPMLPETSTTESPVTLSRMNWLPSSPEFRGLGLPEHWFSLDDSGAFSPRRRRSIQPCDQPLDPQQINRIYRCANESFHIQLPSYDIGDWLITGLLVDSQHGLQILQPISIHVKDDLYLAIKSPPSDLVEGEQFQIHISVIAPNVTSTVNAHVRLRLSADEAFCFKNLMLNSYPHDNMTLLRGDKVKQTSFTATALRRGNYTLDVELWVDGEKLDVEHILIEVSGLMFGDDDWAPLQTTPLANLTVGRRLYAESTNLQLKMRYNKENNQQRCKGFMLKVDHSVLAPTSDPMFMDYGDYFTDSLVRDRRAIDTHEISPTMSRHSLRICYRILQKSARGSYYIDIESFTGYKPADDSLNSEGDNCTIRDVDSVSYDKGKIIMIENNGGNHSWCCFSLTLESTSQEYTRHTQLNQSASVRMHNSNSPGDFCLEFYNLQTESPYSDHICSQHGCLCTEGALSTCKRLRTQSTKKATLNLAKVYLAAKYAFKVKMSPSQGHVNADGYYVEEVVVEGSYGSIHLDTGQKLFIYYKKKKHCQLFHRNDTYLIMGRQLHIPHKDNRTSSLYLDHQASVINMEELQMRSDYRVIECFLDSLLCATTRSMSLQSGGINFPVSKSSPEEIAGIINSNCRYKMNLDINGRTDFYEAKFGISDKQCKADLSHVHRQQRIYQSIRRHRRRRRQRRRRS